MASKRPKILVTNDDGVSAPGIQNLIRVARELGDVLVVAPDSPQSGMGHAVTLNSTLRLNRLNEAPGLTVYSCSGTPVDCVKMAVYEVLKDKPDLVLSGINHGANSSINVLYSGTMSAAIEGAMEGVPSIGFSLLDHSIDADFSASCTIADKITRKVLENGLPEGVSLNVNIPKLKHTEILGIRTCRQAMGNWEDTYEVHQDAQGKPYYSLLGEFHNYDKGEDTDIWALEHHYVSVVPVQFDLTAYNALKGMRSWEF